MTSISYTTHYDVHIFECSGHTGYASAGRDILCSAVSCLCYTLDAYLGRCTETGDITSYTADFGDGYVQIKFEYTDICRVTEIEEALRALFL